MKADYFPLVKMAANLLEHDCEVIGVGCGYGVHRSGTVVKELQRIYPDLVVEKIGKGA